MKTSFFLSLFLNWFFSIYLPNHFMQTKIGSYLIRVIIVIEHLSNYFMKGYYIFRQDFWFFNIMLFPYLYGFVWILTVQWSSNNTSYRNNEVFMIFIEKLKVPKRTENPFCITFMHGDAGNEWLRRVEFRKWAMVVCLYKGKISEAYK